MFEAVFTKIDLQNANTLEEKNSCTTCLHFLQFRVSLHWCRIDLCTKKYLLILRILLLRCQRRPYGRLSICVEPCCGLNTRVSRILKLCNSFFGARWSQAHSCSHTSSVLCLSTRVPCLSTPFQVDSGILLFAIIQQTGLWCQISPGSWTGPPVWKHPPIMKVFSCYTHI